MTPDTPEAPAGPRPSHAHRALHVVRSHIRPGSFPFLLAASLLLYVLNGLCIEPSIGAALVMLGRAAVVVACVYVLSTNRTMLWLGLGVLALEFSLNVPVLPLSPRTDRLLLDSISTAFLFWVFVVVLREVFRPTTSERDAVVGALCGFALILTSFMRMHGLLEAWQPGSYQANGVPLGGRPEPEMVAAFQYFSTITLTTVGFGDIVPVSPMARLVTGLEAMAGQIYLAVVIASLVGRVASTRRD